MNKHKVGRRYDFPDSYIEFLPFLKVGFDIPYRIVEGAVDALSEYISFIHDIRFTQVRRRMVRLLKEKEPSEIIIRTQDDNKVPITVVVDSTGLTTRNKGSYIEDKWKHHGAPRLGGFTNNSSVQSNSVPAVAVNAPLKIPVISAGLYFC